MVVFGASTLGEIVIDLCADLGVAIQGFFDDYRERGPFGGAEVLGNMEDLMKRSGSFKDTGVLVAIGNNRRRAAVFDRLEQAGFSLPSLVHPRALVAPSVEMGPGNLVLAGASVGTLGRLGKGNILFPGVCLSHHNSVGNFNFLGPNVAVGGYTRVGDGCHLGMGSVVKPYIDVKSGYSCEPLSLVDGEVWHGNP